MTPKSMTETPNPTSTVFFADNDEWAPVCASRNINDPACAATTAQLGLTARGVSFPGHFLIKLRMPQGEVVLDPFNGRSLSREELDERLAPYRRRQGLVGEFEAPLGLFLQAAQPRDVLARMLRNLKEIHRSGRDGERWLAVQERLVVLLPQNWDERRDRALALSELGRFDAAIADLEAYLANRPDAEDALAMSERLDELRRMPRLH
jgi:regulator of sirC expression with transglutaminase-like and TPR domain